jgi:hypothetical protein
MNYDDFKSGREEGEIEGFEDGFKLALSKVREIVEKYEVGKNKNYYRGTSGGICLFEVKKELLKQIAALDVVE